MNIELLIAGIIFLIAFSFAISYFLRFKSCQLSQEKNTTFWNNKYIFETIPSVFPTLGIFCTALGITIGIWNFDTADIEGSMPELLNGLRVAFFATMLGILGLIAFQKWGAIISNNIENNPNLPKEESNELGALNTLINKIEDLQNSNTTKFQQFSKKFDDKISLLQESNSSNIMG